MAHIWPEQTCTPILPDTYVTGLFLHLQVTMLAKWQVIFPVHFPGLEVVLNTNATREAVFSQKIFFKPHRSPNSIAFADFRINGVVKFWSRNLELFWDLIWLLFSSFELKVRRLFFTSLVWNGDWRIYLTGYLAKLGFLTFDSSNPGVVVAVVVDDDDDYDYVHSFLALELSKLIINSCHRVWRLWRRFCDAVKSYAFNPCDRNSLLLFLTCLENTIIHTCACTIRVLSLKWRHKYISLTCFHYYSLSLLIIIIIIKWRWIAADQWQISYIKIKNKINHFI